MREHSNIPGFFTQIKDFRNNNVRLNKQVNPKILFNLVFLVKDLGSLLDYIRGIGIIISGGPQKKRDMVNYLELDLSHIDENFINSLYNNYCNSNIKIKGITLTKKFK